MFLILKAMAICQKKSACNCWHGRESYAFYIASVQLLSEYEPKSILKKVFGNIIESWYSLKNK